ncbi:nucleotidyltransferase domain-containing protein, partial [Candidatus Micrarchaeota archaeon]|nr:nucleotidyltransferase domain-containing protein [Candidatus Micrarchaeota archaeon]
FGSAAENQLSLMSDIDLAVKFSEIDKEDAGRFRIETLRKVNEKIDIQVYNILPDKIKKEIDKKGKILWKRE